jgi:hypothetical protein
MIIICESDNTQAKQDLVCNFDEDVLFNSWNDCTAIQVTALSLRRLQAALPEYSLDTEKMKVGALEVIRVSQE